jgi:hypothetical protein
MATCKRILRKAPEVLIGLSSALALLAVFLTLWAGWNDEHRLTLRPVGHLALFALDAWIVAAAFAFSSLFSPRTRELGLAVLLACVFLLAILVIR